MEPRKITGDRKADEQIVVYWNSLMEFKRKEYIEDIVGTAGLTEEDALYNAWCDTPEGQNYDYMKHNGYTKALKKRGYLQES